jgi:hypothetical protein
MNDALSKLQIEHLRGTLTPFSLPFEKGKTLMIIYGENGSGKSSICDALEFLGKGDIGSLNDRGLGKTTKYWSSHGKTSADVSVTLMTSNGSCIGTMARNGSVIVTPPENRPRVEVFRKAQIGSLVEAAPADRYKAVQRFVDVSGVESSEDALRRLIRELTTSQQIAIAEIGQNQQTLLQFWHEAGNPEPGWREWAEAEAVKDLGSLQSEITAIQYLAAAYDALHRASNRIPEAQHRLAAADAAAVAARTAANESAQRLAHDASETLAILSAARTYLSKHGNPSACPLCESAEHITDLDRRVDERIRSFDSVRNAEAEAGRLEREQEAAELQLASATSAALAEIDRFREASSRSDLPEGVLIPAHPPPKNVGALTGWLDETANLTLTWEQAIIDRLDKKHFFGVLRAAVETWRENTETQLELERLLPRLVRALEIVVNERRTFSDDVLASIAAEVGRLYELVHPGRG